MPKSEKIESSPAIQESHDRKLAYSREFKELIEKHKDERVIERTKKLMDTLLEGADKMLAEPNIEVADGDIEVEFMKDGSESAIFRVKFADKEFFVKRVYKNKPERIKWHTADSEIKDTAYARELLKNIDGVEVQEMGLAYKEKDRSYWFVADWRGLPTLSDILIGNSYKLGKFKIDELFERYEKAESILIMNRYREVATSHCFYDRERDKIIFFDLHRTDRP